MKIVNCKTDHMKNPMGYQMQHPYLSFQIEECTEGKLSYIHYTLANDIHMKQVIHEIEVTGDQCRCSYELDILLQPRTRYYWNVECRTDRGEYALSEQVWFETGKMEEPWRAKWIGVSEDMEAHPLLYKEFSCVQEIRCARLYICGLGMYRAFLNGRQVGEELLTPYCNNYEEWVQYQTFDITKYIKEKNRIDVILGNGWYKGRFGPNTAPGQNGYYGKEYALIAEIYVEYTDGTEAHIFTDQTWRYRNSHILKSSIYDGEVVDFRDAYIPLEGKEDHFVSNKVRCLDVSGKLMERLSIPIKKQEVFTPKIVKQTEQEMILDMGQNFSGILSVTLKEQRDTKVVFEFAEHMQNGDIYRDNLRSAESRFIVYADGERHVVEPYFTYFGYRYVKVLGLSCYRPGDIEGIAIYSDMEEIGILRTGNEMVNRLIQNVHWGLKSNFLDVPTDCPQRDERMGWTGDAQVFCGTATYLRDTYGFYRKYLFDLWTEQQNNQGKVPEVIPSFGITKTSAAWGDAACIIPWRLYLFYGDEDILRRQFDSMRAWVEYLKREDGDNHGWRRERHYGDWLALDNPWQDPDCHEGATDKGFIAEIYYWYSVDIVAKTARILQYEEAAICYERLAAKIRRDIEDEFFTKNGRCAIETQTALAMTEMFGFDSNKEITKAVMNHLFQITGGRLQTGFVGTPILCESLCEMGLADRAYDLLLNEDYPGWLYEVKHGATTIWERWNSISDDGTIRENGMNSLNHYAYGSIVEWLFSYAAGLRFDEKHLGNQYALIRPYPDCRLGNLHMEYKSCAGVWTVEWETVARNKLKLKVEIPFGCRADLVLPYKSSENNLQLEHGKYEFEYETDRVMCHIPSVEDTVEELRKDDIAKDIMNMYLPRNPAMPDHVEKMRLKDMFFEAGMDENTENYFTQLFQQAMGE